MKNKHETSGNTPEPASKSKKQEEDEASETHDAIMTDEIIMQRIETIEQQASTARVQTSYLLAQHAESNRDKAKKEIVFGGWTKFTPNRDDLEIQGSQLETQADSRERWIKEIAKKAGITSNYYREWLFSHQTRGEALSPLTVVTVTQPWQRSKLLDYVKRNPTAPALKERFYVKDTVEDKWDTILRHFGQCEARAITEKFIKIQPQISLWDRLTGIPLKAAMAVAKSFDIQFKHSWKDHTLTDKHTGEFLVWAHFVPDEGIINMHLSAKNLPMIEQFRREFESKFAEIINGNTMTKGKGKGKGVEKKTQDDHATLPMNHSSHARTSKYPFSLKISIIDDMSGHWEVWNNAWQKAVGKANKPYVANILTDENS